MDKATRIIGLNMPRATPMHSCRVAHIAIAFIDDSFRFRNIFDPQFTYSQCLASWNPEPWISLGLSSRNRNSRFAICCIFNSAIHFLFNNWNFAHSNYSLCWRHQSIEQYVVKFSLFLLICATLPRACLLPVSRIVASKSARISNYIFVLNSLLTLSVRARFSPSPNRCHDQIQFFRCFRFVSHFFKIVLTFSAMLCIWHRLRLTHNDKK